MSIWLTRAVPTHTRDWPRGQRFARAVWYEVDDIEVANLYDERGELRISCVPGEAVSEELVPGLVADGLLPVASTAEATDLYTAEFCSGLPVATSHKPKDQPCVSSALSVGCDSVSSNAPPRSTAHAPSASPECPGESVTCESATAARKPSCEGSGSAERGSTGLPATANAVQNARTTSESTRDERSSSSKKPADSGHEPSATSHQPPLDPNALAQLARGVAVAERCPFEPTGDVPSSSGHEPPATSHQPPVPRVCYVPPAYYYDPDRLAEYGQARWVRSADHPRRSEWGREWSISAAGFTGSHGRTLFDARRADRPGPPPGVSVAKYDGLEWRFLVDLDRGEFSEHGVAGWTGLVADGSGPMASGEGFTTEALRHGAENAGCPSGSAPPLEPNRPEVDQGTAEAQDATECEPACSSSVPSCLRGESLPAGDEPQAISHLPLCGLNDFPAPSPAMSPDERRGHRRVKIDGRIGWLFGPGSAEQAPLWRAWLSSLQAAFPQERSPA